MIETYGHKLLSSLKEYIDHRLLKDYQAFETKTGALYTYSDTKLSNKSVYGSSYAQWSYHGEVPGVIVPSGFGIYNRSSGNMRIDFINGRAILDSGYSGLSLTGTWTKPDINTYITTYSNSKLISETNYLTSPTQKQANSYLTPDSKVLPALFFRLSETENEPWALGGQEMTEYTIAVTALINNPRYTVGVFEIIRDLQDRILPILPTTPLNTYGDLKDVSWNYSNFINSYEDYALITDSYLRFVENDEFVERNPKLDVGFGSITIKIPRFPRQEFP